MNDEYLWQKTGDDAEVARLENALAVFRYTETPPPAITPAAAHKSVRLWRFPLAMAATGFAGLVFAAGFWFYPTDAGYDVTFIQHPDSISTERPASMNAPAASPAPARPSNSTRSVSPSVRPVRAGTPRRQATQQHLHKRPEAVLTKQEQEAYDRLLLALSISSSKMNIVRNAIDGVEEKDNTTEVSNR